MNVPVNKKKSPVLIFLLFFAMIVVITIISRHESALVNEINIPMNAGIVSVATYGQYLAAISNDNKAYLCDWGNLSGKYQTVLLKADQAVLLKSGLFLSVDAFNPKKIYELGLQGQERNKETSVDADFQKSFLNISRDQKIVVLALGKKAIEPQKTEFEFDTIDADTREIRSKFRTTIDIGINARINTSLSDDGRLLAMCGGKNDKAWMALYEVQQKKILWEKQFSQPALFFNCVFSFDSKIIFARGSDSTIYKLTSSEGESAGQLLGNKENKNTLNNQHFQRVQVSSDGRFTAAVVAGAMIVWDDAGKKIFSKALRHKVISGIAISPDSRFIATSDLRQGGKIYIWRLP